MVSSKTQIEERKKDLYSKTKERMELIKNKIEYEFNYSNFFFVSDKQTCGNFHKGPITRANQKVNVGSLKDLSYDSLINSLVSSCLSFDTSLLNNRTKDELRYLSLSQDPLKMDYALDNKKFVFESGPEIKPIGLSATLKKARIEDNVKIPTQVEKVINDDIRANSGLLQLNKKGFDVDYLSNVLSSGFLGIDKKLVPTRWGITAVDDSLGKEYIKEIRNFDELEAIEVFYNQFLHNHFFIILLPGKWEYEQFELWETDPQGNTFPPQVDVHPDPSLNQDYSFNQEYEPFFGRTTYAKDQGGGYYAARIAVIEHLRKIKKQARVLVIRYIQKDYFFPVGVWQVRENVRSSFNNKLEINSLSEAKAEMEKVLNINLGNIYKVSNLLIQKRIFDFV